jgi:hypothetical protein
MELNWKNLKDVPVQSWILLVAFTLISIGFMALVGWKFSLIAAGILLIFLVSFGLFGH